MSREIDTVNDHLIPLLNEKIRKGQTRISISITAQLIINSISRSNTHGVNLDSIESEYWREHIKRWTR